MNPGGTGSGGLLDASLIARIWSAPAACSDAITGALLPARLCRDPLMPLLMCAGAIALLALAYRTENPLLLVGFMLYAIGCAAPHFGLLFLPAMAIFTPRIALSPLGDELLYLRLDHLACAGMLLAVLRATWGQPHRNTPHRHALRPAPFHRALLLFLCAVTLSALAGLAQGTLLHAAGPLLYLANLYYVALVLILAHTLAPSLDDSALYAWLLPVIAAACCGISESIYPLEDLPAGAYRTFERGWVDGAANHFAGSFVFGAAIGIALMRMQRWFALGLLTAIASVWALDGTGSKTGFAALLAVAATYAWLWLPRLRAPMLLCAALLLLLWGDDIFFRLSRPGSSFHDRMVAWKTALLAFRDYPLLGLGLAARHRSYYDSQYFQLLAECGLAGLLAFLCLLSTLLRALRPASGAAPDARLLQHGAIAATVGMGVHSIASVAFFITIIAVPFTWIVGLILARQGQRSCGGTP
ncbi:MAG: O-antigen ligase family protein [Candidatus Hydrogenedentes bacterium]|nr:O-antigen ligase family protein [Candidatus Hydrogenedentota bacterium]